MDLGAVSADSSCRQSSSVIASMPTVGAGPRKEWEGRRGEGRRGHSRPPDVRPDCCVMARKGLKLFYRDFKELLSQKTQTCVLQNI